MIPRILAAIAAAGLSTGLSLPAANAADLGVGGNCCADLEERIAELEATTARKGNRKVSLTISGWVAQQVLFWDDKIEKNAYVADAGNALASHVKFSGEAKISNDWSAGYVLHVELVANEPLALGQNGDNFRTGPSVYNSFWFVKSKQLGTVSVGTQSSATDNAAVLPDPSGTIAAANYVFYDNNNFFLVRNTAAGKVRTAQNWGSLASCATAAGSSVGAGGIGGFTRNAGLVADCDGVPNNNVKYDSPTLAGFSASASWGEDDVWGVTGRYAGEFNGVKVSVAVGYIDSTDDNTAAASPDLKAIGGLKAQALQIGASVYHVPSGLFVYGAYGKDYNENVSQFAGKKDGDNWYIKAGVRQKWNPLGHSVIFGEYGENNDKQSIDQWNAGITSSNVTQWGIGVQQEIDSAAMAIWAVYRNYSADQTCAAVNGNTCAAAVGGGLGKQKFEDIDIFKIGALIAF
jgi:hypothetical protein